MPRRDRRGASPVGLRRALASRIGSSVAGDGAYAPVEVFVGPPGAGKTTTVAKIAAQERARSGGRLSMVAADGFRVGAVEQLQLYAEIIGSPFFVARTASDVERAIKASDATVLVDTAGRSPSDREARELFDVLGRRAWVRTHLVMPASATAREAGRILDCFADSPLDCVALTRVDEAETLAPLVGLLTATPAPGVVPGHRAARSGRPVPRNAAAARCLHAGRGRGGAGEPEMTIGATALPGPARAVTLAVTSGKGGVGKTSVVVNLAVALARLRVPRRHPGRGLRPRQRGRRPWTGARLPSRAPAGG